MASRANGRSSILTVPEYLAAVRRIHGVGPAEMARSLRVNPSVLRRWMRGTLLPSWPRLQTMSALWGGSPELLAVGAALQGVARRTGISVEEAVHMVRTGRRNLPQRRPRVPVRDRRQLSFPIAR